MLSPPGNFTAWDSAWVSPHVLAPLDASSPLASGSRYALMRTIETPEKMVIYWAVWVGISATSALFNLFVIFTICCRGSLRTQMFNKLVVGLAIPDLVFSGSCAVTCTLNALAGEYFGGAFACAFQSVYCIYGFTASIWMNVVITSELHRLAVCASKRTTYRALPAHKTYLRIALVYAFAMLMACAVFYGLPIRAGAQRGLACLPMAYDLASELFFWFAIVMAMLGVPLVVIAFFLCRVHKLLLASGRLKATKREVKHRTANREVAVFFARLFVVFVGMWLPTALLIWMVVWKVY